MISKYLHLVSSTKSQITIFILLNICGLIFILLPHNIFSNMLDLELFYNKVSEAKKAGKEQYVPGKDYPLLNEYNIIGR